MKRYLILIRPSKTKNDENFPVASWIISTQFRPHIHVFYNCVRAADDVADNPNLKPEEKLLLLKQMDLELQGKSQKTDFVKPAIKLLASSKQTVVTIEHARHLLQAFLMDVEKKLINLRVYKNLFLEIFFCKDIRIQMHDMHLQLYSN